MFGSRRECSLFFFFLSFGKEGCSFFLTGEGLGGLGVRGRCRDEHLHGRRVHSATASSASAVGVASGVLGMAGTAAGEVLPRQWESPTPLPESPRVWQPGRDAEEVGTDRSTQARGAEDGGGGVDFFATP